MLTIYLYNYSALKLTPKMTNKQIELIQTSWSYIIVNRIEAGELFYNRLFQIAPTLRPLFKNDIRLQAAKLVSMVTVIVTKLNKLEDIMIEVSGLAMRHKKYNVSSQDFKPVGEALLWTLEQGLCYEWTPEHHRAWSVVFDTLSTAMIEQINGTMERQF